MSALTFTGKDMPAPKDPIAYAAWVAKLKTAKDASAYAHAEEREARFVSRMTVWTANAPYCACGCGNKVEVREATARQKRWSTYPYRGYLPGHNNRVIDPSIELTAAERAVILGSLLGDGYVGYAHKTATYPRLRITHGLPQKEYALWKAELLARLHPKVTTLPNKGYGETTVHLQLPSLKALVPLHSAFYVGGLKVVPEGLIKSLSPLALAIWYLDDGSLHAASGTISLHTEGFTEGVVRRLALDLSALGFSAVMQATTRGHYFVRLNAKSSYLFLEHIRSEVPQRILPYKFNALVCKDSTLVLRGCLSVPLIHTIRARGTCNLKALAKELGLSYDVVYGISTGKTYGGIS